MVTDDLTASVCAEPYLPLGAVVVESAAARARLPAPLHISAFCGRRA
jgi:hypothetical protein